MSQLLPKLLLVAAALIAAGLGCSAGRKAGEACAQTTDCQSDLICFDGECTPPGQCPNHAPAACGDGSCCPADARACCSDGNCYATGEDCKAATCVKAGSGCTDSQYCCTGLTCQSGKCDTAGPACRKAGISCITSDVCCAGMTCSRFGLACQVATRLDIGEPCATGSQCLSGRCEGFCTKSCATSVQCTDVTYCISTGVGSICVPWCGTGSNTRCSVYAGATCQATTDVDGTGVAVCLGR